MRRSLSPLHGQYNHTVLRHVTCFLIVLGALAWSCGGEAQIAYDQAPAASSHSASGITDPCVDPSTHAAIKEAFHLVCASAPVPVANGTAQHAVVIGFLGGFVKQDDVKHPEVVFANYLRSRYGPNVHAAVFGNHEGKKALEFIREEAEARKFTSSSEKNAVKIILYGHSWGASEVLEFARELERQRIPVALTIQVDSVHKMGQNDRTVPANVARAVNFYQRKGFTPGRPLIVAENAERTTILGNFQMTYHAHDIRCDNYRWVSRTLNKPHHQIENDPHVWDQIVTLIDAELSSEIRAPAPAELESSGWGLQRRYRSRK